MKITKSVFIFDLTLLNYDVSQIYLIGNVQKILLQSIVERKALIIIKILSNFFNNTTAIGQIHYVSTQEPPHSDDKRQLEMEFLYLGAHVDIETEDDTLPEGEATNGHGIRCKVVHGHCDQHSKKEGMSSKLLHLDNALEAWTKSLSTKIEAPLAKAE